MCNVVQRPGVACHERAIAYELAYLLWRKHTTWQAQLDAETTPFERRQRREELSDTRSESCALLGRSCDPVRPAQVGARKDTAPAQAASDPETFVDLSV